MFKKLRNRIIIITMAITTTVLVLAGVFIMLFSSMMRPEPKFPPAPNSTTTVNVVITDNQELREFIKTDREEGNTRLLTTLLLVGAAVEILVFIIVYALSQKIVEPVKDSYEKQKLFIANASHELKTPLAVIQANMEALDVDEENEKWKSNIENEITHANKLVLDLLQLARMDAGNIEKNAPEEVDLNAEIKKRVEMFEPKFAGKITFKSTASSETFTLPKQDILQVLDILLDNATKYGDKKITIGLGADNITVANDGAKISKDDLEKIFDRFYQTDKSRDGSGLGLAIAKALCEQNGWNISCKADKNLTSFTVVLNK